MNKWYNFAIWVIVVLGLLALYTLFQKPQSHRPAAQEIAFSQFLNDLDHDKVLEVVIQGHEIHGVYADRRTINTYVPNDPSLLQRIYGKNVTIVARPEVDDVPWLSLLGSWLPFLLMMAVWGFSARTITRALRTPDGRSLGQVVDEYGSELRKLNVRLEQLTSGQPHGASQQPQGPDAGVTTRS